MSREIFQKTWICLFACVAVRAVHIEVVDDIVAEQFLMALKRNISERGTPIGVILDNAPQFKFTKTTKAWRRVAKDEDSYSL